MHDRMGRLEPFEHVPTLVNVPVRLQQREGRLNAVGKSPHVPPPATNICRPLDFVKLGLNRQDRAYGKMDPANQVLAVTQPLPAPPQP